MSTGMDTGAKIDVTADIGTGAGSDIRPDAGADGRTDAGSDVRADAGAAVRASRPWPVVLLIGLGAWLAAVPLIAACALLLGDALRSGPGTYAVALLMLAGAIMVLRARNLPVFVEQLALPALLVGGGALAFGLYRDAGYTGASAMMAVVTLATARAIGQSWLRALLGALAALFAVLTFVPRRAIELDRNAVPAFWLAWHLVFAGWLIGVAGQREATRRSAVGTAAALESMLGGWLQATLVGLAWLAGMTFLAGSVLPDEVSRDLNSMVAEQGSRGAMRLQGVVSAMLAAAGFAWTAWRWPALRRAWFAGVALVLIALSVPMPMLGAVLLAMMASLALGRLFHASTAALAAVWIVGAFYYRLENPLADKSLMLLVAGALLSALAGIGWRQARREGIAKAQSGAHEKPREPTAVAPPADRRATIGIVVALLLTLSATNFAISQKEALIANGSPVYVELAPVDPRSLMQGDYMALEFRMPPEAQDLPDDLFGSGRPRIVMRRDARGVAEPVRVDRPDVPLSPDELRIELSHNRRGWVLVTDAWFFKEGDAERWSEARFGEFRVDAGGRALLVGMADKDLKRIAP